MKYTTIALTPKVKEQLQEFGKKGERYSDTLQRVLKVARKQLAREFLMDTSDCVPIEEFIKEVEDEWPESGSNKHSKKK